MPLTDTAIKNAKPAEKAKRMFNRGGLYLEVSPKGGKWWRLKYRSLGKEKRLSLGVYPGVSLKVARDRRDDARKLLAEGIDPSENRKAKKASTGEKAANSFEVVAREWLAKEATKWTEGRYAVATGRADRDPSGDLRGALTLPKAKHLAAITEPTQVGELLRVIWGYDGTLIVRSALRLAPLVFVRPGELRKAEWSDIDLDSAEWRYTVTKANTQHIVPLAKQAEETLRELQPLTGHGRFVFPSARNPRGDRAMSDNAILAAMRRMGIDKEGMSGHGFRAMARTILDEVLGFRPDYIEHQLAHSVRDPNGRAYNRTAHLPERKKMMQEWADYLDKLKAGAEVILISLNA